MSLYKWTHIFIPIIALILNGTLQVSLFRLPFKIGLLKSILIGFLFGLAVVIAGELFLFFRYSLQEREIAPIITANIIMYSALGYCYFHFINLGETARRIRILREIHDSEWGLSLDEILERYNAREIVQRRVGRLIQNNQIIEKNGRYFIGKPVLLMIANGIVIMKLLFLGKTSEFNEK